MWAFDPWATPLRTGWWGFPWQAAIERGWHAVPTARPSAAELLADVATKSERYTEAQRLAWMGTRATVNAKGLKGAEVQPTMSAQAAVRRLRVRPPLQSPTASAHSRSAAAAAAARAMVGKLSMRVRCAAPLQPPALDVESTAVGREGVERRRCARRSSAKHGRTSHGRPMQSKCTSRRRLSPSRAYLRGPAHTRRAAGVEPTRWKTGISCCSACACAQGVRASTCSVCLTGTAVALLQSTRTWCARPIRLQATCAIG